MSITLDKSKRINERVILFRFFEKNGEVKVYKKNSSIDESTSRLAYGVYFIKFGFVKVTVKDKDGNEFLELMYGKNDIFPLIALTTLSPERLVYTSVNRIKIYRVPANVLRTELKRNVDLSTAMMNYSINNTIFLEHLLQNSKYKSAHDKLVFGLVLIAIRFGDIDGKVVSFDKIFNHNRISKMVNLSRETVSRELSMLRSKGLIYALDSQLVIIDLLKLSDEIELNLDSTALEQI